MFRGSCRCFALPALGCGQAVRKILFLLSLLALAAPAAAAPDLVADELLVSPTMVNAATSFEVAVKVLNVGDQPAPASQMRLYASPDAAITGTGNDLLLETVHVPALAAGAWIDYRTTGSTALTTATVVQTLPDGTTYSLVTTTTLRLTVRPSTKGPGGEPMAATYYYIGVLVDAANQVLGEANESNLFAAPMRVRIYYGTPRVPANPKPAASEKGVFYGTDFSWDRTPSALRYDVYAAPLDILPRTYVPNDLVRGYSGVVDLDAADLSGDGVSDLIVTDNQQVKVFKTMTGTTTTLSRPLKIQYIAPPPIPSDESGTVLPGVYDNTGNTPVMPRAVTTFNLNSIRAGSGGAAKGDTDLDFAAAFYTDMAPLPDDECGHVVLFECSSDISVTTPTYVGQVLPQSTAVQIDAKTSRTVVVAPKRTTDVAVADFDGDSDMDVIQASQDGDTLVLYANMLKGNLEKGVNLNGALAALPSAPHYFPVALRSGPAGPAYEQIKATDLDNDGRMDLVALTRPILHTDRQVVWLRNTGGNDDKIDFTEQVLFTSNPSEPAAFRLDLATAFCVADLNQDDLPEVFVTNYYTQRVVWGINRGHGNLEKQRLDNPHLVETTCVTAGDLTGDGKPELLLASAGSDKIVAFRNTSTAPTSSTATTSNTRVSLGAYELINNPNEPDRIQRVVLANMNKDLFPDLVSISLFKQNLTWHECRPKLGPANVVGLNLVDDPTQARVSVPAPGKLPFGQIHAWQVLARAGDTVTTGPLWSFKVQLTAYTLTLIPTPTDIESDGYFDLTMVEQNIGPRAITSIRLPVGFTQRVDRQFMPLFDSTRDPLAFYLLLGSLNTPRIRLEDSISSDTFTVDLKDIPDYGWPWPQAEYYVAGTPVGFCRTDEDGYHDGVLDGVEDKDDILVQPANQSFSFASLKVINRPDVPLEPQPAHGATGVDMLTDLRWKRGQHTVSYDLYLSRGTTTSTIATATVASSGYAALASLATADLSGDGNVDLACAYGGQSGKISWLKSNGSRTAPAYTASLIDDSIANPTNVAVGDLNGDKLPDLVVASKTGGQILWYQNGGGLQPIFTERVLATPSGQLWAVAVADLDGDGDQDVIAGSFAGNLLTWYQNNGRASFTARVIDNNLANGMVANVIPADLNGDGRLDLAVANWYPDVLVWYENKGGSPLAFTRRSISTASKEIRGLAAGDLDNDGDVDLATASQKDNKVVWYRNSGASTPAFSAITLSSTVTGANAVAIGDVDGDTAADLLATSPNRGELVWFRSDAKGNPSFTASVLDSVLSGAAAVAIADLDRDTKQEPVCGAATSGVLKRYKYSTTIRLSDELTKVGLDLPSSFYRPSPTLSANSGIRWTVRAKNRITLLNGDPYERETTGSVWTFYTGQPELAAQAVKLNPAIVQTGASGSISFNVANSGSSTCAGHWEEVWASPDATISRAGNDILLGKQWINFIRPASSVPVTINYRTNAVGTTGKQALALGSYYVGVFIDATLAEKTELDKTNNKTVLGTRLTVVPRSGAEDWALYQ